MANVNEQVFSIRAFLFPAFFVETTSEVKRNKRLKVGAENQKGDVGRVASSPAVFIWPQTLLTFFFFNCNLIANALPGAAAQSPLYHTAITSEERCSVTPVSVTCDPFVAQSCRSGGVVEGGAAVGP